LETLQRVYIYCINDDTRGRNLSTLERCLSLTHLHLNHCGLVAVEGLQNLLHLKFIDLSYNNIKHVSCDQMMSLISFNLSHNQLTCLYGVEDCTSLTYLDVSYNDITAIKGIESLENLLHLKINNNQIINLPSTHISTSIISLDLSSNNIQSLKSLNLIFPNLSRLNASNNNLTTIDWDHFSQMLVLSSLDLSRNMIDDVTLPQTTWLPSLTHLNLSSNHITRFQSCDQSQLPSLTSLAIDHNLIQDSNPLIQNLNMCPCFKQLSASDNLFKSFQSCHFLVLDDPILIGSSSRDYLIQQKLGSVTESPDDEDHEFIYLLISKSSVDQKRIKEISDLSGWRTQNDLPPDTLEVHCKYLKIEKDLNQKIRLYLNGLEEAKIENDQISHQSNISCSQKQCFEVQPINVTFQDDVINTKPVDSNDVIKQSPSYDVDDVINTKPIDSNDVIKQSPSYEVDDVINTKPVDSNDVIKQSPSYDVDDVITQESCDDVISNSSSIVIKK